MNRACRVVCQSLFLIIAVFEMSPTEALHWPDFSCHPIKENVQQQNSFNYYRMGWNSCQDSFERTKQECDKMCVLRSRDVVIRSKKNGPFIFDIEAFITLMLNELGYEDEYRKEAPQDLVDRVKAKLEICRTTHREFETMKNFNNLPCEPYVGLFKCVHNATECKGEV